MSQASVELVARIYEAFRQRDMVFLGSALSPDIEIAQTETLPWGGVYRGHAGVQQFFGKLRSHIDSEVKVERFIDAAENVVAIGRTRGKVMRTGAPFDVPIAHVWLVRDAKAVRMLPYIDVPTMQKALESESLP